MFVLSEWGRPVTKDTSQCGPILSVRSERLSSCCQPARILTLVTVTDSFGPRWRRVSAKR